MHTQERSVSAGPNDVKHFKCHYPRIPCAECVHELLCGERYQPHLRLLCVVSDEASVLMALSRNKDPDLMQAFDGCFEGTEYKGHIDDEVFRVQVGAGSLPLTAISLQLPAATPWNDERCLRRLTRRFYPTIIKGGQSCALIVRTWMHVANVVPLLVAQQARPCLFCHDNV